MQTGSYFACRLGRQGSLGRSGARCVAVRGTTTDTTHARRTATATILATVTTIWGFVWCVPPTSPNPAAGARVSAPAGAGGASGIVGRLRFAGQGAGSIDGAGLSCPHGLLPVGANAVGRILNRGALQATSPGAPRPIGKPVSSARAARGSAGVRRQPIHCQRRHRPDAQFQTSLINIEARAVV